MADLGEGSKKLTPGQGETELLNNPAKTHLSPTTPPLCAGLSCSVMSNSLQPHGLKPARLSVHGDSPGKNIEIGCLALLQGIFPAKRSNPVFRYCRRILYCLSHQGSPTLPLCPPPIPRLTHHLHANPLTSKEPDPRYWELSFLEVLGRGVGLVDPGKRISSSRTPALPWGQLGRED